MNAGEVVFSVFFTAVTFVYVCLIGKTYGAYAAAASFLRSSVFRKDEAGFFKSMSVKFNFFACDITSPFYR